MRVRVRVQAGDELEMAMRVWVLVRVPLSCGVSVFVPGT